MVRCKFECVSVRKYKGWGGHPHLHDAEFNVVVGGSEENKTFFAATPSGKLNVATVVPDMFEVGKTYFVDLSPAE